MSLPPGYENSQAELPSYSARAPPESSNAEPPPEYPKAGPAHDARPGIGLFPKYIVETPTRLVIRHANHLRSELDVYIQNGSEGPTSVTDERNLDKIMSGTTPVLFGLSSNRLWTDAKTGQPLFRVKQKTMHSSTYNILAVDEKGKATTEMGLIKTHENFTLGRILDDFDVVINGGAGVQQYARLAAKGDSSDKPRLQVLCDGRRIIDIKRTDKWAHLLVAKRLTWEVDLEPGVDACVAAMIAGLSADILQNGR